MTKLCVVFSIFEYPQRHEILKKLKIVPQIIKFLKKKSEKCYFRLLLQINRRHPSLTGCAMGQEQS